MVEARSLSLQEFLQQPETKPASEYIDGEIIQKPMPKGRTVACNESSARSLMRLQRTQTSPMLSQN